MMITIAIAITITIMIMMMMMMMIIIITASTYNIEGDKLLLIFGSKFMINLSEIIRLLCQLLAGNFSKQYKNQDSEGKSSRMILNVIKWYTY